MYLGLVDAQRRRHPHHVAENADRPDQQAAAGRPVEQLQGDLAAGLLGPPVGHDLDAHHETPAADVAHEGAAILHLPQAVQHHRTHLEGVVHELLVVHDRQHLDHGRRGHRVAPHGGGQVAPLQGAPEFGPPRHGRHRVARPEALADRHHVGFDTVPLEPPHPSGAPVAALHLVDRERNAPAAGPALQFGQVAVGREHETGGAQVRLHDETGRRSGGVGAYGLLEPVHAVVDESGSPAADRAAVRVGVGRPDHARDRGPEARLHGGHAPEGGRGRGTAVKGAREADHLVVGRVALHQPQGGLHGLAAGGQEEAAVEVVGQVRQQRLAGLHAALGGELEAVQQVAGGPRHGADQPRVGMADVGDQHAARPVEVLVAVGVPDGDTGGPLPGHRRLEAGHGALDPLPAGDELARAGTRRAHRRTLAHGPAPAPRRLGNERTPMVSRRRPRSRRTRWRRCPAGATGCSAPAAGW